MPFGWKSFWWMTLWARVFLFNVISTKCHSALCYCSKCHGTNLSPLPSFSPISRPLNGMILKFLITFKLSWRCLQKCKKIKMFSFLFIFCRNIFLGKNFQFFLMKSNLFQKSIFFRQICSMFASVLWHLVNVPLCQVTLCQLTIHAMTFCQLTIVTSDILSSNHSFIWHFVNLTLLQVEFCQLTIHAYDTLSTYH